MPGAIPHLTPAELDQFISDHGVSVRLERATLCPCQFSETGQPKLECPLCLGKAYLFATYETHTALVTNRQHRKNFVDVGSYQTGSCEATFKTGVTIPDYSRITMINDRTVINDEILTRGAVHGSRSLEVVRFPILSMELLVASTGTPYTTPTDFAMSGRRVAWVTGRGPATGIQYTMRYLATPVYVVMGTEPRIRSEFNTSVPTLAHLLRLDVVDRQAQQTGESS